MKEFWESYVRIARRFARDPILLLAMVGLYVGGVLFILDEFKSTRGLDKLFTAANIGLAVAALSLVLLISRYLGVSFQPESSRRESIRPSNDDSLRDMLRELRNYVVHTRPSSSPPVQINIDEEFKGQLLARLVTESQSALSNFIESEVFKTTAKANQEDVKRSSIVHDIGQMLETYQLEMVSWRRNANINLIIGLLCAIVGIGVMWQTLVTLTFELEVGATWKVSELYRFLARFGLVIIIESVAFFFLKLYREDRSMIRYFRNEITNLESKSLALKASIYFGTPQDLGKSLLALSATERNFIVKKGERVMSDVGYENTEIMLEKLLSKYPDVLSRLTKPGGTKSEHAL